jgi:hypothetical protein
VTVLMEASEALAAAPTCAFTVGDEAATGSAVVVADTSSGARTGWSCVYELVAGDSEGVVEFTISSAGDNAGNPLDTVQSVTAEGGIVVFDRTSPTLSVDSVVVSSVGLAASQAGVDDVVALEFTTSEALGAEPTCAVAVGGTSTQGVVSVSDTSSGAGTAWLCDVVLSAQDNPGAIMFSIDGLDASGNDMSQVQRTVTTCTGTHSDGSNCDSTVAFVSSGLVADCPTTNDCVFNTIAFDNAAPVLSAVTIASDNSVTTLAKTGDTLTLAFTADAEINSPTCAFTVGGVTAAGAAVVVADTSTGAGTGWSCAYEFDAGDSEGVVEFTIDATDLAGNAMAQVMTVGDGTSVTFDNVAPTLTTVSIASDSAADATLAKTGDTVTVLMEASEALAAAPTCAFTVGGVTAAGAAVVVADTSSGAGTGWSCAYELVIGDSEGVVEFTISGASCDETAVLNSQASVADDSAACAAVTGGLLESSAACIAEMLAADDTTSACTYSVGGDAAGNALSLVQSVTADGGSVTFDRTAPTLSAVSIVSTASGFTSSKAGVGDVVTLEFTTSEALGADPTCAISVGATVAPSILSSGARSRWVSSGARTRWSCSTVMLSTYASGDVTFTIDGADATGNSFATVQTVTDSSSMALDTTTLANAKPYLTAINLASSNGEATLAKLGDTITLSFTSSAAINPPSCAFTSGGAVVTGDDVVVTAGVSNGWTCVYTVAADDTDGSVGFTVSDVTTTTGSYVAAQSYSVVDDTSAVTIDKAVPTLRWVQQVPR